LRGRQHVFAVDGRACGLVSPAGAQQQRRARQLDAPARRVGQRGRIAEMVECREPGLGCAGEAVARRELQRDRIVVEPAAACALPAVDRVSPLAARFVVERAVPVRFGGVGVGGRGRRGIRAAFGRRAGGERFAGDEQGVASGNGK
jgi:hypothetical protein